MKLADAAFRKGMAKVIYRAEQSGTPVIVWQNGCVRAVHRETWKPRKKARQAMTKTIHGKVHGKTIELDEDLGVVDGQEVEVQVRMIGSKKRLPGPPPGWHPGGTETAAGMMAEHWTEEDDRILEAIERDRHRPSTRELPE